MARGSGAARRRARKIRVLLADREATTYRVRDGGDIIDGALRALRAITALATEQQGFLGQVHGSDLATLLGLVEDEFTIGRAVQEGADELEGVPT